MLQITHTMARCERGGLTRREGWLLDNAKTLAICWRHFQGRITERRRFARTRIQMYYVFIDVLTISHSPSFHDELKTFTVELVCAPARDRGSCSLVLCVPAMR
jgi:hypothetical protein